MQEIIFENYKILDLWKLIDKCVFGIPELQRQFVWDSKKACNLLDSIYKKLPIGTILVWKTGRKNRNTLRHSLHALPPFNDSNREIWFIMDGQQRLSVLHQIREGKEVLSSRGKKVNFSHIHFSLDSDDKILFKKHSRPDLDLYVPITNILSGYWRQKISHLRKDEVKLIEKCRNLIMNYKVPVIIMRTNKIEEVRESFIRINALGTPLSSADKAFARASKLQLRHLVEQARSQWPKGFAMLPSETVNIALSLAYDEKDLGERGVNAAIKKIERKIDRSEYSLRQFTQDWRFLKDAIGKAIDYLVYNFGVIDYSYLPSNNMVTTLALFFYFNNRAQPNAKQRQELSKWFWATAIGQRYAGRGYRTNILSDISVFRRLGINRTGRFSVKDKVSKYDILRSDYSQRSGITNAFFCLLALRGPKYLENGEPIPLSAYSTRSNRKDKHHIFPRNLLQRNGLFRNEFNGICNICFLVAQENQSFGSKKPVNYLKEFRRRKHFARVMKSHIIPYNKSSALWHEDVRRGYRLFRKERLEMICKEFEKEAGTTLFRTD